MKLLLTILLPFLVLFQGQVQEVEVDGLKESYDKLEHIQFNLTNKTTKHLFLYIGLERQEDSNWKSLFSDLNYPNAKAPKLYHLDFNQSIGVGFSLDRIIKSLSQRKKDPYAKNETFRLSIHYGEAIGEFKKVQETKSFVIKLGNKAK